MWKKKGGVGYVGVAAVVNLILYLTFTTFHLCSLTLSQEDFVFQVKLFVCAEAHSSTSFLCFFFICMSYLRGPPEGDQAPGRFILQKKKIFFLPA